MRTLLEGIAIGAIAGFIAGFIGAAWASGAEFDRWVDAYAATDDE